MKNTRKAFKARLYVLVSILILGLFLPNFAQAEHVEVDPTNPVINEKNSLVIEKAPKKEGYTVNTFGNSRMTVTEKTEFNTSGTGNNYKYADLKKYEYSRFEKNYTSKMVEIISPVATDKVAVTYNHVGKYNGKDIGATVTYSGFTYAKVPSADYTQGILELSESMFSGYWYGNLSANNVQYNFFDAKTKESIVINNDVIVGINSLNEWEFAQYLEGTSDSKVYTTADSFVKEVADPYDSNKTVWMGTEAEFNNFDQLGLPGFSRGTVSFQIKSNPFTIRVGKDATSHNWAVWNSLSSANFNVTPAPPTKTVSDDDEKNVEHNELNTPYVGQEMTYAVTQKVNTLGVDLLEKYTSMVFKDELPKEVDFVSAELVDQDGKKIVEPGEIKYDNQKQTVSLNASQDFLQNQVAYNGESYSLLIHVKVNENAKENESFHNQASTAINNDKSQVTNEVDTTPPTKPNLTKKIMSGEKEEDVQSANIGDTVTFKLTADLGNSKNLKSVEIQDPLENVFDYQKITVKNGDKDITDQGDVKVKEGLVSWKAKDPKSLAGQKLEAFLEVKVKDADNFSQFINAETGQIELPNIAKLLVNGEGTDSKKVIVTPSFKENTTIFKQIKKEDGSYADSKLMKKGDKVTFDINYSLSKAVNVPELVLSDDLEDVFTVTEVHVQSDQKDITTEGDLVIDKATQKVTWKAKEPAKWRGKELVLSIDATLSNDADLEAYIGEKNQYQIPNTATAKWDKEYKSNTVHVNVEQPLEIKAIPKTGAQQESWWEKIQHFFEF
ncbi:isopeptide-forming domain-containing fimbrial protein [Listeria booriae]|uniref:Isopeptide-forming domain-containing fimbrial protein n=1 Tax=Listeria booriae TaxID=1552123 RepID=A0A842A2L9_9LIST|nr:isopeptide-forming domain-containing fimbrial protein [Listeria booriae]MBC1567239.1 isopeptide-forming domain-containing fimbrial protein [Listeria booriae]